MVRGVRAAQLLQMRATQVQGAHWVVCNTNYFALHLPHAVSVPLAYDAMLVCMHCIAAQVPVEVILPDSIKAVAAGESHTLALTSK